MYLVLVTVLIAVCGADKLDRTYLPPASAHSAGGSPGSLQTPFRSFNQGLGGLPKGGYKNEFDGVVVDAAAPGTRASGPDATGLGGPRIAYGSTDSKVGEAAFTGETAFPRVGVHSGNGAFTSSASGPDRIQSSRDRASNTVKYENEVSHDGFNYAFETDNGILAEENGIEVNGVKAQGGYSYTGDDGQVYSVTYTADEDGYRPRGDHLPTPPPIPEEILKSLEQNAKEEASGIVDDGSYDAQKYNTGEDYTKTDRTNEKYNGPSHLGRPQTDAASSSSFISQNNQAFARPGFNQFGSTVAQSSAIIGGLRPFDSSKNVGSNINIGIASNAEKTGHHGQAFGFGSGSQNENQAPTSNVRGPALSNQPFGTHQQINAHNTGIFGVNNAGNKDQNTEQTFIPLSQQKLQSDNPKRPQGSSPVFGKPTVIDSTLSIKDPFASRPSGNRFPQNNQSQKPLNNGQIGGSFQVVSGNVYSSKNEYLPPRGQSSQFNKPTQKGSQGSQASSFGSSLNGPSTDFKPQSFGISSNKPAANAFASASNPTFGFQSQINRGQQSIQYGGSGLSGLGQTFNNRLSLNKGQSQFTSGPASSSGFSQISTQTQYKPSNFGSQSPTSLPQTELTTPLESNSNENVYSPAPVIDGPGSPSIGSTSNNFASFSTQPPSNFFGQSNFNKFQQASPTQASVSSFASVGAPVTSGLQRPGTEGNSGAQFLNKSPFDVQSSSNTPRPSFIQNAQQQGFDDSYFYNTPSKPFNVPTARPQASQFPSSSSDQAFRVTQTPFDTKPQSFDFSQTSFASQSSKLTGSTRYPSQVSSLEPISPTLPTEQIGNNFQTQFNKVTQASVSSFASAAPTPTAEFPRNQFGQFPSKPSQQSGLNFNQGQQSSNLFNQPSSSFAQATATKQTVGNQNANQRQPDFGKPDSTPGSSSQFQQTQQYNGEIYEYNKPPQTIPGPHNTEPGQQQVSSSSQTSGSYKPSSQFGSQFTQQPFGQTQQGSHGSQPTINGQFESQSQSGIKQQFGAPASYGNSGQIQQTESRPNSLLSKPASNFPATQGNQAFGINAQGQSQPESRPSLNSGPVQGASKFPPAYNKDNVPDCCKTAGTGSQSSQIDQESKVPQFGAQFGAASGFGVKEPVSQGTKPVQSVSSFAGVGETFGGPRKPPSFDASGYHY